MTQFLYVFCLHEIQFWQAIMSQSGLEIFGFLQWIFSLMSVKNPFWKEPQFDTYAHLFLLPILSVYLFVIHKIQTTVTGVWKKVCFFLCLEIIFFIEFIPGQ